MKGHTHFFAHTFLHEFEIKQMWKIEVCGYNSLTEQDANPT